MRGPGLPRIGCNEPRVATFSFNSDECFVWIDRSSPGCPGAGALCNRHADRLTAHRAAGSSTTVVPTSSASGPNGPRRAPPPRRVGPAPRFAAPGARRASRPTRHRRVAAALPLDAPIAVRTRLTQAGSGRSPELDRLLDARSPLLARAFQPSRSPALRSHGRCRPGRARGAEVPVRVARVAASSPR